MTTALLNLLIALSAGMALGLAYFGGLWWTVRALPRVRRPALLILGSFLARTGLFLAGFFLIGPGHWERLAIGLLGFLAIREILLRGAMAKRTPLAAAGGR